jgi:hypothetical protein
VGATFEHLNDTVMQHPDDDLNIDFDWKIPFSVFVIFYLLVSRCFFHPSCYFVWSLLLSLFNISSKEIKKCWFLLAVFVVFNWKSK